jgi:hypothetical protein
MIDLNEAHILCSVYLLYDKLFLINLIKLDLSIQDTDDHAF